MEILLDCKFLLVPDVKVNRDFETTYNHFRRENCQKEEEIVLPVTIYVSHLVKFSLISQYVQT